MLVSPYGTLPGCFRALYYMTDFCISEILRLCFAVNGRYLMAANKFKTYIFWITPNRVDFENQNVFIKSACGTDMVALQRKNFGSEWF